MTEEARKALQDIAFEFRIEDLDQFIQSAWQNADFTDAEVVAELIERAVEILNDQYYLWLHVVETEDCELKIPDGWYSFIAVHPQSRLCLTFYYDPIGRWKCMCFRARIRNLSEAVDAVIRLAELIRQNLRSAFE